jgi:hypothetical protein
MCRTISERRYGSGGIRLSPITGIPRRLAVCGQPGRRWHRHCPLVGMGRCDRHPAASISIDQFAASTSPAEDHVEQQELPATAGLSVPGQATRPKYAKGPRREGSARFRASMRGLASRIDSRLKATDHPRSGQGRRPGRREAGDKRRRRKPETRGSQPAARARRLGQDSRSSRDAITVGGNRRRPRRQILAGIRRQARRRRAPAGRSRPDSVRSAGHIRRPKRWRRQQGGGWRAR